MIDRPVRGGDRDGRGDAAWKCSSMLTAKLFPMIDVEVGGVECRRCTGNARDKDQLIIEQHPARKVLSGLRHETKRQIDQINREPTIDLLLLARPHRDGY